MTKYRGFENEINAPGLGRATSFGTGLVYAPAPVAPPTVYVRPPVISVPITQIPGAVGIPGDIRPITARIIPGEAIEMDPSDIVDEMAAEMGVPGVDETGAFPYGDPKATGKPGAKTATGNQGLFLAAAIAATLFLGG